MIYRVLSYFIMASLFATFLTFLLKGLSVYLDISRYRGLKGLPEYKRFEDILRHIAQQFRSIPPDHIFHTNPWTIVYLVTNWLVVETWWNVKVYLADDLLLAHRHEEAHHVVKKPGEWSSAILVSIGNAIRIPGKGTQLNALLKGLQYAYPWIQIGYTEETENAWFDDIKKLTDAAKRKKEKLGFIDFGASL